jgi:hypothetical protein
MAGADDATADGCGLDCSQSRRPGVGGRRWSKQPDPVDSQRHHDGQQDDHQDDT